LITARTLVIAFAALALAMLAAAPPSRAAEPEPLPRFERFPDGPRLTTNHVDHLCPRLGHIRDNRQRGDQAKRPAPG